jgi:hypothetical protein
VELERAKWLRNKTPQLVADLRLYSIEENGRKSPVPPGVGFPCVISKAEPLVGYDAWPVLNGPMSPGEERRLGFYFFVSEHAEIVRSAGKFYLWEGRFVGEAKVVD